MNAEKPGSLTIVGTGIASISHCSLEAKDLITAADKVLTAVPEPVALEWIRSLNPNTETMTDLYFSEKNKLATYRAMVDRILNEVRAGQDVCAVFYGHPGVFVLPSHLAIQQARAEGYPATMSPGISAADCLFADLGVDPSHPGCQMYEATAFLFWQHEFSANAALILWQVGVLGDHTFTTRQPVKNALLALQQKLLKGYPLHHPLCIYEAAQLPIDKVRAEWLTLEQLPLARYSIYSTLYLPPKASALPDAESLSMLGLTSADIGG